MSKKRQDESEIINQIITEHRFRDDFLKRQLSIHLTMCAIVRRRTDCKKDEAPRILKKVKKGAYDDPVLDGLLAPWWECLKPLDDAESVHRKRLEKLASQLRIWKWVETIRGVGPLMLAQVVGETGDLSNYSTPSKVWKRMGLAVLDGERQRKIATDAEKAKKHGYNSHRRSIMWNLGACLLRCKSQYKEVYDERKEYELTTGISLFHAHRRAQRYMEKKFLRDLWRRWNGVKRRRPRAHTAVVAHS